VIRTAAVVSMLVAGPTFAGDSVVWGEKARSGALRVMHDGELIHRVPPAKGLRLEELEASSERFAMLAVRWKRTDGGGAVGTPLRPVGGPLKGPAEPLRERCAESLAVDGDRIVMGSACGIAIHSPAGVTKLDVGDVHDVALAGRYLAWTGDDVVVHDLVAGADVLRIGARELRAGLLDEVAVQPDGIVAFTYGGQEGHQVAWAAPGTPGVVGLDAAPRVDDLRMAGGRVLYERRRGVTERRRTLLLRTLSDGTARRLARFDQRRRRRGDLDLEPGRAAWAVNNRIVVRDL
jgi:hypothetical protein